MCAQFQYSPAEQTLLLALARRTLADTAYHRLPPEVNLRLLPPALAEKRACFVTLRSHDDGALRGCIGILVARSPLASEVVAMTVQTARHDPRFPPVTVNELDRLWIEISVLTPLEHLTYTDPQELLRKLRPGVDGVILQLGHDRATFLPHVWKSYPEPDVFLNLLAQKMGHAPDTWRDVQLQVHTYQVVEIREGA